MTAEERKQRQIRRLLASRQGRRLAVASLVGVTGTGAFRATRPAPEPMPNAAGEETMRAGMIEQLAGRGWDLPNLDHERVDYFVDQFRNDPEMRTRLETFLSQSGQYIPMISVKLAERDMPHDLIFLAMIESGFDPAAYSSANASGLWQFIAETGRRYGLDVDSEVDERNHPEKATEAALDYLGDLHDRFGSWYLAAAAYNTGEGRVGRIMREVTGSERATGEEAYYRIWDRLPKETRDYVPLMIAAARIAKEPAKYGFEHVIPMAPLVYDEVPAAGGTPLARIAAGAEISVDDLKAMNPFLKGSRTPSTEGYGIRVPRGSGQKVLTALGDDGGGNAVARSDMAE